MEDKLTAIERAFELARSGKCYNLMDVSLQLKTEGYSIAPIEGPTIKMQLRHLIDISTKRELTDPK